ncbi:hypothetical protein QBC46DRAFT_437695 [Diplogelasinospora grovesii]|uniref:Uncharacterized protein n=1 Tax=Diplogelasinospora grovesii TaxID=303347 RepID=A0AAN6NGX3_9PEZI|nr:hypothetical protein QBC46DRAFT_437695 [Diplogelasinospora grovesii]
MVRPSTANLQQSEVQLAIRPAIKRASTLGDSRPRTEVGVRMGSRPISHHRSTVNGYRLARQASRAKTRTPDIHSKLAVEISASYTRVNHMDYYGNNSTSAGHLRLPVAVTDIVAPRPVHNAIQFVCQSHLFPQDRTFNSYPTCPERRRELCSGNARTTGRPGEALALRRRILALTCIPVKKKALVTVVNFLALDSLLIEGLRSTWYTTRRCWIRDGITSSAVLKRYNFFLFFSPSHQQFPPVQMGPVRLEVPHLVLIRLTAEIEFAFSLPAGSHPGRNETLVQDMALQMEVLSI